MNDSWWSALKKLANTKKYEDPWKIRVLIWNTGQGSNNSNEAPQRLHFVSCDVARYVFQSLQRVVSFSQFHTVPEFEKTVKGAKIVGNAAGQQFEKPTVNFFKQIVISNSNVRFRGINRSEMIWKFMRDPYFDYSANQIDGQDDLETLDEAETDDNGGSTESILLLAVVMKKFCDDNKRPYLFRVS
ncbi:hypothetical protein MIR68_009399 [Amoeboaphelidium protococcarum]|nr:hypothetical protein MIR68_009399 [Amoeboaphelidium protococcarum]